MAGRIARRHSLSLWPPRASYCVGLAALVFLLTYDHSQNATAVGETRSISMHHTHTGEDITITFKHNGRYDEEALKKLNWFLRDWRTDEPTKMDPKLFDMLSEVYREVRGEKPIHIISAYRSPKTNAMLRKRSRGVARTSQHMAGRAIDFVIPDVPLEDQRIAGLRLQNGGVGYYPGGGNNFVHMDTGSVRHWPRMTREQLARVFPNGRTVHLPSDGQPLAGFSVALADIEKRGGSASEQNLAAAREAGAISAGSEAKSRGLLARLFGVAAEEDEDAAAKTAPPAAKPAPVPMPRSRPAGSEVASSTHYQVASASSQPATYQLASISPQVAAPSPSANQAIASRGVWQELPADTPDARPRLVDLPREISGRGRDEPDVTGGVGGSGRDRIPATALAYAAQFEPAAAPRTEPMGSFQDRVAPVSADAEAAGQGTTIAVKTDALPAGLRARTGKVSVPVKAGERFDEPWLRAAIVTPSVRRFMTSTFFTAPDFRNLQPLLRKPAASVFMTFSADPHRGLVTERFNGEAIVFLATVTFDSRRTASLH